MYIFFSYLTDLHWYVTCSDMICGGFPNQIIRKIAVRIRHNVIHSYYLGHYPNSRFSPPSPPLHHPKTESLTAPTTTVVLEICSSAPLPPRCWKSATWLCIGQGVLGTGNVYYNCLQIRIHQCFPNQRLVPSSVPHLLRRLDRYPACR